jgi:uncharacterized protein (DUF2237 family)
MPLDVSGGGDRRQKSLNVLGTMLEPCSYDPITGFYRDGCCATGLEDTGNHTVCIEITAAFLAVSKAQGNDLSTPRPEYGFAGLKAGDRWCLCAPRWQEAFLAGVPPRIFLRATEMSALQWCKLDDLKRFAVDLV